MKKIYLHLIIIAIVGFIAYSNSFSVPFQFDDKGIIAENSFIKDITNLTPSAEPQKHSSTYEYNPRRYIGYVTFALNYRWGGLDVTGYHVVNLLIHLINSILVYFFVILTFKTPYFTSKKLVVSSEKEKDESQKQEDVSHYSLLTTHYSPVVDDSRAVDYSLLTIDHSHLIALFSALLFVAHPVQTQAVTYIVQRFTSLAALFYLLAIVMYIKGRLARVKSEQLEVSSEKAEEEGQRTADGSHYSPLTTHYSPVVSASRFTILWYLLSLVSAVCAMKTKEISFTLPIMIIIYEFTFFKSTLKRKLVFMIPVLLLLAIVPISVLQIDRPLGEMLSDLSERSRLQTDMPRWDYLMTELRVIVTYLRLLALPVNQNIDYDYPIYHSLFRPSVFFSFLLLLLIFGAAVYLIYKTRSKRSVVSSKKEETGKELNADGGPLLTTSDSRFTVHDSRFTIHYLRLTAFGILWFFIGLSVESSVIPIVDVIFEHRLYLPSIGAFVALSSALYAGMMKAGEKWHRAVPGVFSLAIVMLVLLSGATFARNGMWQEELGLWENVAEKSPGNPRVRNNLGFLYNARGMNDPAIEQLVAAVRLRPDYFDARINLSNAYTAQGMNDLAIDQLIQAISLRPEDAGAYNNLGIALVSKGMHDQAITYYKTALRLKSDYAEAYNNLGVAYGGKGMLDQARENFEYAIRLKPDYFEAYHNLALAYEKVGDYERAAALKSKAKDLKPAYR